MPDAMEGVSELRPRLYYATQVTAKQLGLMGASHIVAVGLEASEVPGLDAKQLVKRKVKGRSTEERLYLQHGGVG